MRFPYDFKIYDTILNYDPVNPDPFPVDPLGLPVIVIRRKILVFTCKF